jgi:hypothetical protein
MVTNPISRQALIDAAIDVETLDKATNDPIGTVTPRRGASFSNLRKVLQDAANAVPGLLPTVIGQFLSSSTLTTNWNSVVINGNYYGLQTAIGSPTAAGGYTYGIHADRGATAVQFAISVTTSGVAFIGARNRTAAGSEFWASWKELPLFSSAEIAALINDLSTVKSDIVSLKNEFSAGSIGGLFINGTIGSAYDLTNTRLMTPIQNSINTPIKALFGNEALIPNNPNGGWLTNVDSGLVSAGLTNHYNMHSASTANDILGGNSQEFTIAFSHKNTSLSIQNIGFIISNTASTTNAFRVYNNSVTNGVVLSAAPNRLGIQMNGISDGTGVRQNFPEIIHNLGEWIDIMLIIKLGDKASSFYVNGKLTMMFTAPSWVNEQRTSYFGQNAATGSREIQQNLGRYFVLQRALSNEDEIALVQNWIYQSHSISSILSSGNKKWKPPILLSTNANLSWHNVYSNSQAISFFNKAADEQFMPASMTKLMTAATGLYWIRKLNLWDMEFSVTTTDITGSQSADLIDGDILTLFDVLANMGLPSSNVTAVVMARNIGEKILQSEGSVESGTVRFAAAMNSFSNNYLKMSNSHWVNFHGLFSAAQLTTASDMIRLARHVSDNEPMIKEIWGVPIWTISITKGPQPRQINIAHTIPNITNLDRRVVWGKTGTLASITYNLIAECELEGGGRYFYLGRGDNNTIRYVDFNAVLSAVDNGISSQTLAPQLPAI